ncbi:MULTISPECIES: HNH endonuclease signature motif containing protein [Streptomyces]|uniref:HNH endonuclease signature motif containing protein n=1 Tax=Streptomyces TaxID=1883 RepID=UPI00345C2997
MSALQRARSSPGRSSAVQDKTTGRFRSTASPQERFLSQLKLEHGCWLWVGFIDRYGYGKFKLSGRSVLAHRWAYEHYVGSIADGLVLDHLCRVRHCVNPEHLEAVTARTNTARGRSANREKTHCNRGHAYTPENTFVQKRGGRVCRTCIRARKRRSREAKREA